MADFAHEQLSRVLRADLPAGVEAISEVDAARLFQLVEAALDAQEADIRRAERDLLGYVPLPLRGAVKRVLR
ncbi:MAG: hypothetical protein WBF71_12515 [Microthrixaceae bacterium]